MTDEADVEILEREYGIRLLRRTVAKILHDLGIPDCRNRSQRMNYLVAPEGWLEKSAPPGKRAHQNLAQNVNKNK